MPISFWLFGSMRALLPFSEVIDAIFRSKSASPSTREASSTVFTPILWVKSWWHRTEKVKSLGKKVGLAVNPPTAISSVEPYLDQIDLLLVMTVNPGFGGQEFIREGLPKIQQAAVWRRDKALSYRISVDGGINDETGADCARAGADTFVAGTSLFGAADMKSAVNQLRRSVSESVPH